MNKNLLSLAIILVIPFYGFIESGTNFTSQKVEKSNSSTSIPPEIYQIFQNSCFDCHSKGGKKMALNHVNFSEWDKYSADKKAKKSADIVRMLKKGAMPPKIYRQSHPEKIPTTEQVSKISKWADSLKEK